MAGPKAEMTDIVMAYIVMAYVVMAHIVMAYVVMAHIVMAPRFRRVWFVAGPKTATDICHPQRLWFRNRTAVDRRVWSGL